MYKKTRDNPVLGLKNSLIRIFSIGAIILGLLSTGWALINIQSQSAHAVDTYQDFSSSPLAMASEPVELSLNDSVTKDRILYPSLPSEGDEIGSLSVPALKMKLPMIQGTGEDALKQGVGHFIQSVLPGESDNCVLSGHRDTVFTGLDKVKIGDLLIVETSAGVFTYAVIGTRIVDKEDRTVIVPTDHAVLTLSTCYPFGFLGNAPERYIVSADLVSGK